MADAEERPQKIEKVVIPELNRTVTWEEVENAMRIAFFDALHENDEIEDADLRCDVLGRLWDALDIDFTEVSCRIDEQCYLISEQIWLVLLNEVLDVLCPGKKTRFKTVK